MPGRVNILLYLSGWQVNMIQYVNNWQQSESNSFEPWSLTRKWQSTDTSWYLYIIISNINTTATTWEVNHWLSLDKNIWQLDFLNTIHPFTPTALNSRQHRQNLLNTGKEHITEWHTIRKPQKNIQTEYVTQPLTSQHPVVIPNEDISQPQWVTRPRIWNIGSMS